MKSKSSSTLLMIVLLLFVALFVFFLYTFLHEGGHAITGVLFGQSLTEFDISFWDLSAHVGMVGGALTESQLAFQAAAGASLPLLIWALFISLVPRKAGFTLETLKLISSMAVVNTLLAWMVLPVLFLLGKAPSDDVTNFLIHSQMPPLLLIFLAFLLYVGGWILFLAKIDGLRNEFLLFSTTNRETLLVGTRRTIPALTTIMAFCIAFAFLLNSPAETNLLSQFSPPQGFSPIAQIDLSKQDYSAVTLAEFTLDEVKYVGIFPVIKDIDTNYFDLSLLGPNGFSSIIMHGEEYRADQDGGLWEQNLPAGTYQVVLTSHQSPGMASVYLKIH